MGKGGLLWQIDRKRKFYTSFGTSLAGTSWHNWCGVRGRVARTASTCLTAITLCLCLLLYVNIWSSAPSTGLSALPAKFRGNVAERRSSGKPGMAEFRGEALLVTRRQLGNENESVNDDVVAVPLTVEDKLKKIFKKADINRDGYLSGAEISKWINEGIKLHFSSALRDNFDSFFRIDKNPRNGRVEWAEYLEFYLKSINYEGPPITPESLRSKDQFKKLPKHIKVDIAALEARWSESASNDPEFLTVDEFLAFTHPEASPSKLLAAVQDTFSTFDLDGDGVITKTEFDTTYSEAEGVDSVYKEDLHLIDVDKDTQITRVELMRYMDPKNMIHSDKEAKQLISRVDSDQDGYLTLEELLKNLNIVTPTKLFDVAKNLHVNQLHS